MPNKIYVSKHYGAGNPAVYEQAGVSLKKIGADIPSSMESWTASSDPRPINRTCTFEGEEYTIHDDSIYKLSASGTWDVDYVASIGTVANTDSAIGLFPVLVDGSGSYLYYVWKENTNIIRTVRKSSNIDGAGLWEAEVSTTLSDFGGSVTAGLQLQWSVLVDNTVYWGWQNNAGVITGGYYGANLETENVWSMNAPPLPPTANSNVNTFYAGYGYVTIGGELYFTLSGGRENFGQRHYDHWLYRISGSILSRIGLISRVQGQSDTRVGLRVNGESEGPHRHGLIRKNDNLYAFVWATGTTDFDQVPNGATELLQDDGWSVIKMTPSGSTFVVDSDVSDPVLPVGIRRDVSPTGAETPGVGARFQGRWNPIYQFNSIGQEEVLLYYENDGSQGSLRNLYKFVDDISELELLDVGSDAYLALPTYTRGGGSYEVNTIDGFIKQVVENNSRVGEAYVDVRVKGSGQSITMQVLFDVNRNTPETPMIFTSVSSGILMPDNTTISGIIADESIVYRMSWIAETQGVPFGKKVPMNPRITLL